MELEKSRGRDDVNGCPAVGSSGGEWHMVTFRSFENLRSSAYSALLMG
jgi:hypothetical protein